jgi:hypothetical protein
MYSTVVPHDPGRASRNVQSGIATLSFSLLSSAHSPGKNLPDPDPVCQKAKKFSIFSIPEPEEPDAGLQVGAALLPAGILHHLHGYLQLGKVRYSTGTVLG